MSMLEKLKLLDKKWTKYYLKNKIFEVEPSKKQKFFVTFPYPYVNGAPHIGHSFSFFRTDSYARFKRLQGYNVLFAQGFHATGEPIFGAYERFLKGDKQQIQTFIDFGATKKDLEEFKKGPEQIARFWQRKWMEVLKQANYSVDWRRTFITIDEAYKKFVEWQFWRLKEKGYIKKANYPVVWCPHCKSPTGDHARLVGEGEEPIKFTIIKFKLEDKILPCATLRPETVYGVTNVWVNPREEYYWVRVGREVWLLAKPAIEKLKHQLKRIEILEQANLQDILGKHAINPVTNKEVPILPARFVSANVATGVVMSVPAHAPYDYVALKELEKDEFYKNIVSKLTPIQLFEVPGYGKIPAKEIVEKMQISSQDEKEKLDKATEELYKKEYYEGKLKEMFGKLKGKKIEQVKDKIIEQFKHQAIVDEMWELSGTVICRCKTPNIVKILRGQWFIDYGNEEWKKKALNWANKMKIYPEEARSQYIKTIENMKPKPCARRTGLGTKLPWDRHWVIEALSDSTIYPSFYIIAKYVNEGKIKPENLKQEFFDFVFLGKGDIKEVSEKTGVKESLLRKMKEEFEYFYPVDLRNSGKDLLQNHLVFYLFNHIAIWHQSKYWPKAISVNGFVNVEGQKMSKSKGNVIPLQTLLDRYGSDLVRANIIISAENLDDANWQEGNIKMLVSKLGIVYDAAQQLKKAKRTKTNILDSYMLSLINSKIESLEKAYEELKFRTAFRHINELINNLKLYLDFHEKASELNHKVLKEYISKLSILMWPIFPNFSDEVNKMLGSKKLCIHIGWPKPDKHKISKELTTYIEFIETLREDLANIMKITKIKQPKEIKIIVAQDWKFEANKLMFKGKKKSYVVDRISKKYKLTKKEVAQYLAKTKEFVDVEKQKILEILNLARHYLAKRYKANIIVEDADVSKEEKAKVSNVMKPAILLK